MLVPFYQAAKEKVESFGWTSSSDIEQYANTAMAPVLSAMRFNMGMAAKRGWLQEILFTNGSTLLKIPADFTWDQAISWTRLGQPGRWTSMELMSMLIILEQNQQYLDEDSGKA